MSTTQSARHFPIKKGHFVPTAKGRRRSCVRQIDEDALRSAISATGYQVLSIQSAPMRRRASSPSESKRHAGCTFILGRLDRHPVARGAGGYLPTGGSTPLGRVPVYPGVGGSGDPIFAAKGGLILEWAGHRRLSLSTDQVLFLPVRTEAYRGRFASEPFYGTLVRMEAKTAWSTLRAMHSDLGESISRAWNDPCMLRAALWSEALFSALDYMQLGHIGDYYVIKRWKSCSCSTRSGRGWP